MSTDSQNEAVSSSNFIKNIIDADNESGLYGGKVVTRFPPEPNGYLHIGHAKSICLNFGISKNYATGHTNLRFDDTNPEKEDVKYMEAIKSDVDWLGFDSKTNLKYASDYFEYFYEYALKLIEMGKAYVCDLNAKEMREYRGTLTQPGTDSPYRDRSIEENLSLFSKMKDGSFEEGKCLLRAKIDMSSGNINLRDPAIYRIRKTSHPRTAEKWCIYPMYDFAHCLSDYKEKITHSLCTLEFQDHRPLYDWFLQTLTAAPHPHQYEFSRLNLSYTVLSKRKLKTLVDQSHVDSWDDPRLPTIAGIRRRGYTPQAIRTFCERIGISKKDTVIDMSILEDCLRDDLNSNAKRAMSVLNPIKVIINNYQFDGDESLTVPNHPQNPDFGSREMPFSKEIYIEQEDFSENPPPKYHRLSPGKEVRLRYAYVIKCEQVIKDEETGKIKEIRCSYDPNTLGKKPEGRKVKGIIHWVSAKHSEKAEVRLYDRLFNVEHPTQSESEEQEFTSFLNPNSLVKKQNCYIESSLAKASKSDLFQFERLGYFCLDKDSTRENIIFNRSVTLRDTWKK